MKKSGFTLIELLIVITIIAILAGAVLPYVQQYIEDSKNSKVRQDLDEIANGLIRYETDQSKPYTATDTARLVGAYLSKAMADPWGSPYVVAPASSTCYSIGPDHLPATGDEIKQSFRPPLAISRVFWEDTNGDMVVNTGDKLQIKFTRPITGGPVLTVATDDLVYSSGAPASDYTASVLSDYNMTVKLTLAFGAATPFMVGSDTVTVKSSSTIVDGDGTPCKSAQPVVIKAR